MSKLTNAEKQKRYRQRKKAKRVTVTKPSRNAVTHEAEIDAISRVVEEREQEWRNEIEEQHQELERLRDLVAKQGDAMARMDFGNIAKLKDENRYLQTQAILKDSSIKHYEAEFLKLTNEIARLNYAAQPEPQPPPTNGHANGYHFVPEPVQQPAAYDLDTLNLMIADGVRQELSARRRTVDKARRASSSMRTGSPDVVAAAQASQREKEYVPQRSDDVRTSIKRALAQLNGR